MFGRSILVCPKIIPPNNATVLDTLENKETFFKIECYLPETDHSDEDSEDTFEAKWYWWYDGTARSGVKDLVEYLPDNQQGIWARGGSIIPMLLHTTEMSVL